MKKLFFIPVIIGLLSACQSGNSPEKINVPVGVHTAVVKEVLQTSQYTYLNVNEGNSEKWLAVSKMQASTGETYYYKNVLLMNDFESKELNRTFKEILFIDDLSKTPDITDQTNTGNTNSIPPESNENAANNEDMGNMAAPSEHLVVAEEVLQTSKYTYLRVKENNLEQWIAVARMEAKKGDTYYFKGGLPMTDFVSKELNRTFKDVLFVDNLSSGQSESRKETSTGSKNEEVTSKGSAIDLEKKDITIKHNKDDITIAKILEQKKSYAGKTIKLKGQVTKFTGGIMKKNWIHLQDGTEYSGKFDLAVTTDQEVKVGDNITVEGMITLDKDFGYGYYYDVIIEDAKLIK